MAHFAVMKATKFSGRAQRWNLYVRRPYVSAVVWDCVDTHGETEFRTAAEAKEFGRVRYGVKLWARHSGRGSSWYHGENLTREAMPVFFVEHDGEVCAIFPSECGTNDADVTCYAHVGQHGTASQEFARDAKSVSIHDNEDAKDLMRELRGIYEMGERITDRVSLYIEPKRFKAWHHNARFDAYMKGR